MKLLLKTIMVEWKINSRNFANIFFSLIFPIMILLLFGSIYGNEPMSDYNGLGNLDLSTGGYICMVIAVSGLVNLPVTLSQYRESKILKRFMATPIKPSTILISQLIVNVIITLIGSALLLIIGEVIYNIRFLGNALEVFLGMLLIMFSIFSIGLFMAAITKNAKAAQAISTVLYFPMIFLSGATIPLVIMPDVVISISKFLPLTYGVELLQGLWLGGSLLGFLPQIGILFGITIVFGAISIFTFKWE